MAAQPERGRLLQDGAVVGIQDDPGEDAAELFGLVAGLQLVEDGAGLLAYQRQGQQDTSDRT